jgi:hypothetical protein
MGDINEPDAVFAVVFNKYEWDNPQFPLNMMDKERFVKVSSLDYRSLWAGLWAVIPYGPRFPAWNRA